MCNILSAEFVCCLRVSLRERVADPGGRLEAVILKRESCPLERDLSCIQLMEAVQLKTSGSFHHIL